MPLHIDIDARELGMQLTQLDRAERDRLLRRAVWKEQLLRCAMRGMDAKAAARVVGISAATAQAIYREPDFRRRTLGAVEGAMQRGDAAFTREHETIQDKIQRIQHAAFDQLVEVLENPNAPQALKVKVAQDFLDRGPEAPRHHATLTEHKFSVDELANAARAADELARHNVIPIREREGAA